MFYDNVYGRHFSRVRWRQAVVCVVVVTMLCIVIWGCSSDGGAVIVTADSASDDILDTTESAISMDETGELTQLGSSVKENETVSIVVHVCGQVSEPGVYRLSQGSRVWDAVLAAGGCLPEAVCHVINLALPLTDGSKVTIPDQSQSETDGFCWYETGNGMVMTIGGSWMQDERVQGMIPSEGLYEGDHAGSGKVDINRADVSRLMTIPGIGQTRAEAIVAYREMVGPFGSIEQIMEVTGIKEGLFAKIKEYITVGG